MIAHVVLLKPRPMLSPEERRAFVAAFEHAVKTIPTVRRVQVGARVRHGAGYEAVAPDAGDYVAIVEFASVPDLQIYLQHPAHAELGRLFGTMLAAAMVYDFDMGSLEKLQTLV